MAYRPLYPPWTAAFVGFFLFVACLASLTHEEYGAAVVTGLLAGFCAGVALTKELYRRMPPWINTVMGDTRSTVSSLASLLEAARERDELRSERAWLKQQNAELHRQIEYTRSLAWDEISDKEIVGNLRRMLDRPKE